MDYEHQTELSNEMLYNSYLSNLERKNSQKNVFYYLLNDKESVLITTEHFNNGDIEILSAEWRGLNVLPLIHEDDFYFIREESKKTF
jgi:hypothetical protein